MTGRKLKVVWIGIIGLAAVAVMLWTGNVVSARVTAKTDRQNISVVVQNYIRALIDSESTFDTSELQSYTTDNQALKDQLYIAYNHDRLQVREIDSLADLSIDSINLAGDKAQVQTKEVWNVMQQSLKTNNTTDLGQSYYTVVYGLVKQNGKWLVDSVQLTRIAQKKN